MTRLPAPAIRPPMRLAVLACTAALLLVGCGGDGAKKTPKVATLQDGSKSSAATSASPSASESTSPEDTAKQLVAYAACMRKNGVQMADPEVQADGRIEMKASAGVGADAKKAAKPLGGSSAGAVVTDPNFAKAQKACKQYEPKRGKDIDPQKEAEMQAGALAYAKCMRENGVDMPDPQFDEGGGVTMQMGGPAADEEKMKTADKVCRKFLGDRGDGGDGGDGGFVTNGGSA